MSKRLVTYLELETGERLISCHRHDFKRVVVGGETYFIDGGQGDYIRYSFPERKLNFFKKILSYFKIIKVKPTAEIKRAPLEELFPQIREELKWGSNYDKNGNFFVDTVYRKLKDLEDSHLDILIKNHAVGFIKETMIYEKEYRKIISKDK